MNLTICKKICSECPFTASSPKGWLGPHTLDEVVSTQQRGGLFSCHLLRKEDMSMQDIKLGVVRMCRGYIASATKSGIIFSDNSEEGKALQDLQVLVDAEAKEDEEAILSTQEFKIHHGKSLPQEDIAKQALYERLGYKS